ncbi:MAG: ABC transporter ATP-binding protein/permease [Clostridia bacterium]|nr:ABC transporter ATP-binding protein/permease [Clostridia bacterium]
MLHLKNITKVYETGAEEVHALKGIDIQFRKSEFVSILGQSGCGKTTLLNIIGGLDRYTDGDLIINGKSTKEFKDKDWDSYRNYSVGFVFQSYNLIPHQSVLSNVELSLTLSGYSKKEKKKKAIKALESVGLKDQIYKKPSQLSGGQMQRVAIARAIVNDPDIILADEPTGALDTATSVQIMDLLKEISKDKLIIMVTHNPDLAEKYSNRVIKILDGKITDDSNPYNEQETVKQEKNKKKTSMSFFTAFALSLNNLMTKKGRTFLTSIAGSIGIIGIALIMSLSNGIQNYIKRVEEDTLSSYPITIEAESIDISSMMEAMMGTSGEDENLQKEDNKVYSRNIMTDMLSTVSSKIKTNNLKEFKKYLEKDDKTIKDNANSIEYGYGINLNMYSPDTKNGVVQVNPSQVMNTLGFDEMMGGNSMGMSFSSTDVWTKLLDNKDLVKTQYDLLAGKWAENYNEVVLIIDQDGYISDYTLYSLGILSQDELEEEYEDMTKGNKFKEKETLNYTYDELLDLKFKLVLNTDYYKKENGIWIDKSEDKDYMKKTIKDAEEIKIVGIIKPNEESSISDSSGLIGYLTELQDYVIEKTNKTEIVKEQKKDKKINVFTGVEFPKKNEDTTFDINKMTAEQKAYYASLSSEELAKIMTAYSENSEATYENNLKTLGVVDVDSPESINIYPKSFDAKETISNAINDYNTKMQNDGKDENVISYTDIVGAMMKSVTTIINAITNVLIAFVAISLIVSSIMIAIITYISVLERTKEIGILRAMGTSKKDISKIFNAETFIEGLFAGLLGIGITALLNIPIGAIIKLITGISGIAKLPVNGAITLVVISVILTVIAGFIPSKMAAKKDPAVVLRSE